MLTLASLFDGIGGFCLAFQRAGAEVVATVEIDTAAAAVSHRHFPQAAQFDDVTKVTADDLRSAGFVPDRGIITAGWPCQDFSVAGRRAGLDGARSGLWWEVVRILAELRPRWFVGENVPGLLSSVCDPECAGGCMETHGGAMGAVLGSLADLGYGVAYRVLDAQHFGVPQQRRRVFIVGHLGAHFGSAAEILFEPKGCERDSAQGWETQPDVAAGVESGIGASGGDTDDALIFAPPVSPTLVGGSGNPASHGKRNGSDRVVGTCGADDNQAQAGHLVVHPLALRGREGGGMLEIGPEGGPYNALRAGDGCSSRQSLVCITGQVTHTLTSEGADASEDGSGRGTPIVTAPTVAATLASGTAASPGVNRPGRRREDDHNLVGMAADTIVRRLTELECERLQGYPDGWTAGQSGSARYRQLGNSVAVPVVEWIARRLVEVDGGLA